MDYVKLKDEITADPLVRGYATMTDQQVADSLNNVIDRPNTRAPTDVVAYMLDKKHRTNNGTDTVYSPLLGRLLHAAESAVGSDPFGRGAGNEILLQQVHACKALVFWLDSPNVPNADTTDVTLPLGYINGAGVISTAQKDEISALSTNQISRAAELGIGRVLVGDVEEARRIG